MMHYDSEDMCTMWSTHVACEFKHYRWIELWQWQNQQMCPTTNNIKLILIRIEWNRVMQRQNEMYLEIETQI